MHINEGKTAKISLIKRLSYALNPDKTDDYRYVSSYACDPQTVDKEFMLSKQEYFHLTGRVNKNDIIAYQLRQSFKPGEVTPEEANAISYELASRLLKGQYAFIVATHVDKKHIHSHIIFNSTSLDCTHKYKNPIKSYIYIRQLADMICREHQLSVVENPGPATGSYEKTDSHGKRLPKRDIIRADIDEILGNNHPKTFSEFLKLMSERGYEIKKGNHTAVKNFMQKEFIRLDSLGENYTEEDIIKIISGAKPRPRYNNDRPSMLIDIQKAMNEGKGIGYQNWAKVFNLKQMARAYSYLQENNLRNYSELESEVIREKEQIEELQNRINASQKRLDEITLLKNNILTYVQSNDLYKEYKASKFSKQFYEKNKDNLDAYIDAKHYFDSINLDKKLPKIKDLNEEFQEVLKQKREAFNELLPLKREYRKHLIYQENIKTLLNYQQEPKVKQRAGLRE